MTRWRYRAYAASGALHVGTVEATTRELAIAEVRTAGGVPFAVGKISPTLRDHFRSVFPTDERLRGAELVDMMRELAALVSSSLPIDEALALMARRSRSDRRSAMVERLRAAVSEGVALSMALSTLGGVPGFVTGMARAGEESGQLGVALTSLAEALDRELTMRRAVQSALLYPAILLIMTLFSVATILLVVVPGLSPLLSEAGDAAPASARALIAVSEFLQTNSTSLAIGLALVGAGFLAALRTEHGKAKLDFVRLTLPVIGLVYRNTEAARIARSVGSLLDGGVTLPSALGIAADACGSATIRVSLTRIVEVVKNGSALSVALEAETILPATMPQMVAIGERSGRLPAMLHAVADTLERDAQLVAQRLVALLPSIMTIVLGGLIAFIVLSILSAVMSVNDLAF